MLKLDWGDAQVWMDVAENLYTRNAKNREDAEFMSPGYPHGNEMNVSAVCAGYAFELIYKVLVKVGRGQPIATHSPSCAHKKLSKEDRKEVERIILSHGWKNHHELLTYLDNYLCHGDRKYWMRPKSGGKARGNFYIGGLKGIVALKRLHKDISKFAMERINETGHEIWPGTDEPSGL